MKKRFNLIMLLNIPEIIFLLLYFFGIACKIMHLPFANLLLTLVLLILPNFYMLLGTFTMSNVDPRDLKIGTKYDTLLLSRLIIGFFAGITLAIYTIVIWGGFLRLPWVDGVKIILWILAGLVTFSSLVIAIKRPAILLVLGRFILSVLGLLAPAFILGGWR